MNQVQRIPALLVAALLIAGCGPADREAPSRELVEIPHADLGQLGEQAHRQVAGSRGTLEQRLADPATTDADLAQAFGRLGMLYHAYSMRSAAEACYRNASTLAPDEFRWHYYLGRVHYDRGELQPAADRLRLALEIEPQDVPALARLAQVEFDANRHDEAQALYRRALEADPRCAAARGRAGQDRNRPRGLRRRGRALRGGAKSGAGGDRDQLPVVAGLSRAG